MLTLEHVLSIIEQWYRDGEKGVFGGNFQRITDIEVSPHFQHYVYDFQVAFGGAYYAGALQELNQRLEKIGYYAVGSWQSRIRVAKGHIT